MKGHSQAPVTGGGGGGGGTGAATGGVSVFATTGWSVGDGAATGRAVSAGPFAETGAVQPPATVNTAKTASRPRTGGRAMGLKTPATTPRAEQAPEPGPGWESGPESPLRPVSPV